MRRDSAAPHHALRNDPALNFLRGFLLMISFDAAAMVGEKRLLRFRSDVFRVSFRRRVHTAVFDLLVRAFDLSGDRAADDGVRLADDEEGSKFLTFPVCPKRKRSQVSGAVRSLFSPFS